MCARSPARPSETSIAALARPRRRSPSSTRGSGSCRRRAARADRDAPARAPRRPARPTPRCRRPAARPARYSAEARRHLAQRRDVDGDSGAARGVAADQLDAEAGGEREEPGGERLQPASSAAGKRERERAQRGAAPIAARSERLTASALWPSLRGVGAGQEMPPFDQHVGGDRELHARRRAAAARSRRRRPAARASRGRSKKRLMSSNSFKRDRCRERAHFLRAAAPRRASPARR